MSTVIDVPIHAPGKNYGVGFLWPKASLPLDAKFEAEDGRPVQIDRVPGPHAAVVAVRTIATKAGDDVIRIRAKRGEPGGRPISPVPDYEPDDLAKRVPIEKVAGFRIEFVDEQGRNRFAQPDPGIMPTVQLLADGPVYTSGRISTPRADLFVEWWHDAQIGVVRVVGHNSVVDTTGREVIETLRGRVRVTFEDRVLDESGHMQLDPGRQVNYRYLIGGDLPAPLTAGVPEAAVSLPMAHFAKHGIVWGIHPDAKQAEAKARARWQHFDSFPARDPSQVPWWRDRGHGSGGDEQLAPIMDPELCALINPRPWLEAVRGIADCYPYAVAWNDRDGDPITPRSHPGMMLAPKFLSTTFRDTPTVRTGELATPTHFTDPAHQVNPGVAPYLLTADPFYGWLISRVSKANAMAVRGLSGRGWKLYGRLDGPMLRRPSNETRIGRGPTGSEGFAYALEERALGWALIQRAHALALAGDDDIADLAGTCLRILRGHYLDRSETDDVKADACRWWGFRVKPLWHHAVHEGGPGVPPVPFVDDGSGQDAYASPANAIATTRAVRHANSPWQAGLIACGVAHLDRLLRPWMPWLQDLVEYVTGQPRRLLKQGLPPTTYCTPVRSDGAWFIEADDVRRGWYWPGDADIPADAARAVEVDDLNLCTRHGYAYTAYGHTAFLAVGSVDKPAYADWMGRIREKKVFGGHERVGWQLTHFDDA